MKWRSPYFLGIIILGIIVVVGSFGYVISHISSQSRKQSVHATPTLQPLGNPVATVYSEANPPIPGPGRMTYTNTKYGYSFVYPSQWRLSMYTNQNNVDVVQGMYQAQAGVDGYPFEVGCLPNPEGLNAQSWFNQNGSGTGIGYITLKSGETAYLDIAHGQVGVKDYTLAHDQSVCLFSAIIVNPGIDTITDSIINSFKWQQ